MTVTRKRVAWLGAGGVFSSEATSSLTITSGKMPASSHASSALSTASFTQVSSALRGLSKPRRCLFLVKNSETEISRCRAPISTAVTVARGFGASAEFSSFSFSIGLAMILPHNFRRYFFSLPSFFDRSEKCGGRLNANALVISEFQQIVVARHDDISLSSDRALEKFIVGRVAADDAQTFFRAYHLEVGKQLLLDQRANLCLRQLKSRIAQHPQVLVEDRAREQHRDRAALPQWD